MNHDIDPSTWLGRESEGILVVADAGEVLCRVNTLDS